MGLNDMFRREKADAASARGALDAARGGQADSDAITTLIQRVLSLGLDGRGFFKGAAAIADSALRRAHGDTEKAIHALARGGRWTAAGGGFVTSLGGFVMMPVAIPANLFEFYVLATRTVGAIATLRGYDVTDPTIRTAVLLTLVGSKSHEILERAGIHTGVGALNGLSGSLVPRSAEMMIQKAVGFSLLRKIGEKSLTGFGRAVPLLGGGIGGVVDGVMLSRIAHHARAEFPACAPERDWGVR